MKMKMTLIFSTFFVIVNFLSLLLYPKGYHQEVWQEVDKATFGFSYITGAQNCLILRTPLNIANIL